MEWRQFSAVITLVSYDTTAFDMAMIYQLIFRRNNIIINYKLTMTFVHKKYHRKNSAGFDCNHFQRNVMVPLQYPVLIFRMELELLRKSMLL